jgi:hypothetical protein
VVVGGTSASVTGSAALVAGAPVVAGAGGVVDVDDDGATTVEVEATGADLTSDGPVDPQAAKSTPTTAAPHTPMVRERATGTPLP